MAITSYGFTGSLNAATWAAGENYTSDVVKSATDLAVTAVGGARAVSVSAGEAFCAGVRVVNDSAATVTLGTPSAGQWFLIALRRDWTGNAGTFVAIGADTTTTAVPTAPPSSIPSGMNTNAGVLQDQPLAWAWVNNTSTTVTLFDCRQVVADGIAEVMSTAGLLFLRNVANGTVAAVRADQPWIYAAGAWQTLASWTTASSASNSALSTETTNRTNADNTLQTNINNEANSRASQDTTLQNNINGVYSNYDNGRLDGRYFTQGAASNDSQNRVNNLASNLDGGRLDGRYPVARVAGGGLSLAGGSTGSVTFPGGRFSSEPWITTGIFTGTGTDQVAGISNASSSGFTMYYWRNGSTASATINWIAVQ